MSGNYFRDKYGQQQPGPPADPAFQTRGPQAQANLGKTEAEIRAIEARTEAIAQQNTNNARNTALAEQKFTQEQQAKQRELDVKRSQLQALETQLQRTEELFKAGPGRTKGVDSLWDYNSFAPENARFDAAAAGLAEIGYGAFRVPGAGPQSDNELKQFVAANKPSSWDTDAQVQEKIRNLRMRLGETMRGYGFAPNTGVKPPARQTPSHKSPTAPKQGWWGSAPRKPSGNGGWKIERLP